MIAVLIFFLPAASTSVLATGADDITENVLLAELNNYCLGGGCTSLWSFEVLSHDSKMGCKIFPSAKKVNSQAETYAS